MAPTVFMSEVSERLSLGLEHHLASLASAHAPCRCPDAGERKRNLHTKRKLYRNNLQRDKVLMGLVVEECTAVECHATPSDSLVLITLRTLALLRRNQLLQHRLSALRAETRAFVQSMLHTEPSSETVTPSQPATT